MKREAENALGLVGELRDGPIAMPKDQEWIHFVTHEDQVVDPSVPLRSPEQIHFPGQDHLAAQEIRAGLLERKSKYLKSYTAGWCVLNDTHHLFIYFFPRLTFVPQVRPFFYSPSRIQVCRQGASPRHVALPPRAKARIPLRGRKLLQQVYP